MSLVGKLVVAAEENLALMNGWRAQAAGSDIHGGACLRWTYTPQPLWLPGCDRALLPPTAAPADADALLEEALAFYEQWETAIWCTTSARRTPPEWHGYLKAAGWRYQFSGTCMAADLHALPAAPALPEAVEIGEMRVDWGERKLADAAAGANPEHPYFGALQVDSAANEFAATLRMAECGRRGSSMRAAARNGWAARCFAPPRAWRGSTMWACRRRRGSKASPARSCGMFVKRHGRPAVNMRRCRMATGSSPSMSGWVFVSSPPCSTGSVRRRSAPRRGPSGRVCGRGRITCCWKLSCIIFSVVSGTRRRLCCTNGRRWRGFRQTNGATALHVVSFHGEEELTHELLVKARKLKCVSEILAPRL